MIILVLFLIPVAIGVYQGIRQSINGGPTIPAGQKVLVRTYKTADLFQRDANKLAGQGWTIQTQSSRTKKWGATTGVLTNKGLITVTYGRG